MSGQLTPTAKAAIDEDALRSIMDPNASLALAVIAFNLPRATGLAARRPRLDGRAHSDG